MASRGTKHFLWYFLTILVTFGQFLDAAPWERKIKDEVKPKADGLEVRLDYELYKRDNPGYLFSSHLKFDEKPEISDKQLKTMAIEGYKEMEGMISEYGIGNRGKPTVITILAFDNEIFLASSQKGDPAITEDSPVTDDLDRCRDEFNKGKGTNTDHTNQRKCGEVMAFDHYYKSRVDPAKLGPDARIAAIAKVKQDGVADYIVIPPCGTGEAVSGALASPME